ncbi:MAG: hypothetical protein LBS74_02080 [Oscillospiraceae bacterium]|jgi:hypothetical protein|nr:hypothetical protein [Oscillospiraceae bacterium]
MIDFLNGALSGIIQIGLAVLILYLAIKVFSGLAKWLVTVLIAAASVLLIKGIIDWTMIASAGESLFQWIGSKF